MKTPRATTWPFWVISTGEPLPIDGTGLRLYRAGMLATRLAESGHRVTWWTAQFSHRAKLHRDREAAARASSSSLSLRLLPSMGYSRHASPRRLLDHAQLGVGLASEWQHAQELPRAVYCAFPTIEFAAVTATFCERYRIPWVADIRDMWPDIFVRGIPRRIVQAVRPAISVYDALSRNALAGATALTAPTDEMLDWGLAKAGRTRNGIDAAIPFGSFPADLAATTLEAAHSRLRARGLDFLDGKPRVLYAGGLTSNVDFASVATAVRALRSRIPGLEAVIFGSGDQDRQIARLAGEDHALRSGGWVSRAELVAAAASSAAGLLLYAPTFDFEMSIPNKVAEYLSQGLPIISSLIAGPSGKLIREQDAGWTYPYGDSDALAAAIEAAVTRWAARGRVPDPRLQKYQREELNADVSTAQLEALLTGLAASRA